MLLYRTPHGPVVETDGQFVRLPNDEWNDLINRDDLPAYLATAANSALYVARSSSHATFAWAFSAFSAF